MTEPTPGIVEGGHSHPHDHPHDHPEIYAAMREQETRHAAEMDALRTEYGAREAIEAANERADAAAEAAADAADAAFEAAEDAAEAAEDDEPDAIDDLDDEPEDGDTDAEMEPRPAPEPNTPHKSSKQEKRGFMSNYR